MPAIGIWHDRAMAVGYRVATMDDLGAVTAVMATAFSADPVWGPYSFPDDDLRVEQLARFWRPQLAAAMRFPWTLVTASCEAAAVWIPPGEPEMTPAQERDLVALTERMLGPAQTRVVFDVFRRLEDAHPERPHYYLSLLGTHEDHRGQGLGMGLLAATLEAVDGEGLPAYLESTNPANDARYARVGFRPVGAVELENGHRISTMWRDPR
jgi:GNAT superfamily N-acetyltransferase